MSCRLPTFHADDRNGWNGSNNDGLDGIPCRICGGIECERVFYHSAGTLENPNGHIVVCWPCSQKLPSEWHGCGCGG